MTATAPGPGCAGRALRAACSASSAASSARCDRCGGVLSAPGSCSVSVLARRAARRRDPGAGARSDRRRLDGDCPAGARCGDRDDAARQPRRHPGLHRAARALQLDAPARRASPTPSISTPRLLHLRYAIYVVLWNLLAAFALWGPRGGATPIAPALSWLSGVGLVAARLSRRALPSIDWILSLEPTFWSSIFR